MRLALVFALALIGWGCKREPEEPAAERLKIGAEVIVAPVVDKDPWVIAFLTEVSITRPPGADARLEGRNGPGGLRHPEPILEGDVTALEGALSQYQAKHPRSPELWDVWQYDPFGPGERVACRLYFIDRSRGILLDGEARASLVEHDHGPSVHLYLGEEQRKLFMELTTEMVGGRIAILVDRELVMLPVVMEPIVTGEIQLLTRTHKDPRETAPALLDRLHGS
jgi:hypothetical protein